MHTDKTYSTIIIDNEICWKRKRQIVNIFIIKTIEVVSFLSVWLR